MAREFSKKLYNSKEWKKCRGSYIVSVNGLCERCLTRNRYTPGYIVHHIIELTPANINDTNITLNHSNLAYHCLECHNAIHFGESEVIREGLCFDVDGNIIKID